MRVCLGPDLVRPEALDAPGLTPMPRGLVGPVHHIVTAHVCHSQHDQVPWLGSSGFGIPSCFAKVKSWDKKEWDANR